MTKEKSNSNPSHPIDFDSNQLKELEKLIDSLKKEIVLPSKKGSAKSAPFEPGRG
ncbi:hypothetical protein HZA56_22290 [Candidatus Poribacteria bacterium]|nr:hypothetical protein [Candidatus Poribacteria bacterium]